MIDSKPIDSKIRMVETAVMIGLLSSRAPPSRWPRQLQRRPGHSAMKMGWAD